MKYKYLVVEAKVRYWEDAEVNGVQDTDGSLIPFREGGVWAPIIDLELGILVDWPEGITADIYYKVCDQGEYWLADESFVPHKKWVGDYVPDAFLCHGDDGYGDYVIMKVDEKGGIDEFSIPPESNVYWDAWF